MRSAIQTLAAQAVTLLTILGADEFVASAAAADEITTYRSHPPMRPLPTPAMRDLSVGPQRFVDAARGDDGAAGTQPAPWKSLRHSLRQLKPGDTLYLRGGIHYEKSFVSQSGSEGAPITISSYPGELAIIDGGLREFAESPATSWQPLENGAAGEFVSTKTYFAADDHQVPRQFLPGAWEPMWGIEGERPLALGNFADSLVPLHSYRLAVDLRSSNELWIGGKNEMRESGIYCGAGLWFNRETGRIHIRLAHHRLAGLAERAYRGEQDPRKPVEDLEKNPIAEDVLLKLRKGKKFDGHMANFIECTKDRSLPVSDVYAHHRILTTCHLANIALRLGRKLNWDAKSEQITGDEEANAWQSRAQRKGYEVV